MKPAIPRFAALAFASVVAALAAGAVAPAAAAVGEWAAGARAKVRLVVAGVGDDGRIAAGIEIALPTGWKTYWRNPGDAGIAPVIDLSASRNLGPAAVSFPLPHRTDDGYSVTNVYQGRVVLPVSAEVLDRRSAVEIVLSLDLGVCQDICIPDHVEARLVVPAGENDAGAARMLAAARAALPGPLEPGVFFVSAASRDGGSDKRPVYRFAVTAPDAGNAVVFVEGPPDWFADAPVLVGEDHGTATYTVKFDRLVATTPIAGASLRITAVAAGRAIEQTIGLD